MEQDELHLDYNKKEMRAQICWISSEIILGACIKTEEKGIDTLNISYDIANERINRKHHSTSSYETNGQRMTWGLCWWFLGVRNCFKSELVQKKKKAQSLASIPKSKIQNNRFQLIYIKSSNEFLKNISDVKLLNARCTENLIVWFIYMEFSIEDRAIEHRICCAKALIWK